VQSIGPIGDHFSRAEGRVMKNNGCEWSAVDRLKVGET
jgi:hypothetical protein